MEIKDYQETINKILENIDNRCFSKDKDEILMNIIEDEIKNLMASFNHVSYLRKDCVNIIGIDCGMLPKPKADDYMKTQVEIVKSKVKGYEAIYCGYNSNINSPKVSYIEKGKLSIIEISTGMMPKDRADDFIKTNDLLFDKYRENGYDIQVIGKANGQKSRKLIKS